MFHYTFTCSAQLRFSFSHPSAYAPAASSQLTAQFPIHCSYRRSVHPQRICPDAGTAGYERSAKPQSPTAPACRPLNPDRPTDAHKDLPCHCQCMWTCWAGKWSPLPVGRRASASGMRGMGSEPGRGRGGGRRLKRGLQERCPRSDGPGPVAQGRAAVFVWVTLRQEAQRRSMGKAC
jgi:hypothetical protein